MTNIVVSPPKQKGRKEKMLEEKEALEILVSSCKSLSELNDKLDEVDNDAIDIFIDSYGDGTITIGVKHCIVQLSTIVNNSGRVEPSILYVDSPWIWYNIKVPEGFIFK